MLLYETHVRTSRNFQIFKHSVHSFCHFEAFGTFCHEFKTQQYYQAKFKINVTKKCQGHTQGELKGFNPTPSVATIHPMIGLEYIHVVSLDEHNQDSLVLHFKMAKYKQVKSDMPSLLRWFALPLLRSFTIKNGKQCQRTFHKPTFR